MRTFSSFWIRLALASGVGVTQLVACASHTGNSHGEQASGKLSLALESTAPSGNTYRLRNARFQIVSSTTGQVVDTLSSEDSPASVAELHDTLLTGDYSVVLLDGWFLERLGNGGGGGFGGSFATAGAGGGMSSGGSFAIGGSSFGTAGSEFGVGGAGALPDFGSAGAAPEGDAGSPDFPPGNGGFGGSITGGFGGTGGSSDGTQVEAQLQSSPTQFFSLFGGDDAFVSYQFKVGKDIVDFTHGKLHIGIQITEQQCQVPDGVLDPQRVLLETHVDAVSSITLGDTLAAIASNGGRSDDPTLIYHQIIDSYASAPNGRLPTAIHCGDEQTNGAPSLNGYPIECDRAEAKQFDNEFGFFPTAFVNRIDLAPENGAHCGQQRVIFANNLQNRMFLIFEAQIPNPHPELGIIGCQPLAQFWLEANTMADASARGKRLANAFTQGDPELAAAGFGPFLTATNFTVGSGQIRTNQFDQDPWTLREFKLAVDSGSLVAVPFPTAESPNGGLWDEAANLPQGSACRENFLSAIDGLLDNDPSKMSFVVDDACKDAESRNDDTENYARRLSDGFRGQLEAKLSGTGLSADDIANRAQFAGSCIGCHDAANGKSLGLGVFAPFSNGFVQVQEFPVQCSPNDPALCFQASPALQNVFLPTRLQAMGKLLNVPIIPNPCDPNHGGGGGDAGAGGDGGFGGSGGFGGDVSVGGSSVIGEGGASVDADGGFAIENARTIAKPVKAALARPAVSTPITLPSASLPVAELQREDTQRRDSYGGKTLGGKSAHSTH